MVFNCQKRNKPTFTFDNTVLKIVKEYKYLGTTVTNTGNFKLNELVMECHPVQLSYPFLFTITIFHFPLETKSPLETWISILDTLTTYNLCEKNVFCDSLCLGPLGLSSNESVWVGAIKIPLGFKNHYDLC